MHIYNWTKCIDLPNFQCREVNKKWNQGTLIEILNANNYPFVGWNFKISAYQGWIVWEKKIAGTIILAFYELSVFITWKGIASLVKSAEISIFLGQIMLDL